MATKHQTETIRILLAENYPDLRAGLKALLETQPELKVVGEAQNGVRALTLARELQPVLILLDLTMPGISGPDILRTFKGIAPRSRVLVLTMSDDENEVQQMLTLGASGYVLKQAVVSDLLNAIQVVLRGETWPPATLPAR